jgi:hypothetical protein
MTTDIKITLVPTDLKTRQTLAALHMLSEGTLGQMIPAAESITLYRHGLSTEEFLAWADRYDAKVNIQPTCAAARIKILNRQENGIEVEFVLFCNDLSDGARRAYATHNEECIPQ